MKLGYSWKCLVFGLPRVLVQEFLQVLPKMIGRRM
jgi:hypothetical protein